MSNCSNFLVRRKTDAAKGGVTGTVGLAVGLGACVCIMVGLAIKVQVLKKSASLTLNFDEAKKGENYAEMHESKPPASVANEMVVIENPEAIDDDLITNKSMEGDVSA